MAGEDLGTTDENAQNDAEAQGAGTQADAQDGSGMQELNGNSVLDETDTGVTPENNTEDAVTRDADAAFEKQLAQRDKEIEALKAQVAEEETELNARIAELEAKAEAERTDYELTLAGCRSTRAGRVLLEDHDGDIAALKAAEPWLFEEKKAVGGVTGLPNAGAATSDDATLKRWREIADSTTNRIHN